MVAVRHSCGIHSWFQLWLIISQSVEIALSVVVARPGASGLPREGPEPPLDPG